MAQRQRFSRLSSSEYEDVVLNRKFPCTVSGCGLLTLADHCAELETHHQTSENDRRLNSSTSRSTSQVLPAGDKDMTLDFGMVYRSVNALPETR